MSEFEMLRTFNCGVGMVLVVEKEDAASLTAELNAQEPGCCFEVGKLTEREGNGAQVSFTGSLLK